MYIPQELALELKIKAADRLFQKESTRQNWLALCRLVGQRSPSRVKEMEQQKGLR